MPRHRPFHRTLTGLFAVLTVGAAAAAPETKDLMARLPDGRRLHLVCAGEGAPTVLLEGGFAATARAWWKVQPLVARSTRVCAYDRAGAGQSDPGPFPRDARAIADDLGQALRQARIAGPYVVVGHSAGGLYVRAFADLHPREVVGMVLLDPSVEHQDRRFAEVFGPGAGSLKVQRDRALRCEAAARAGGLPSSDPALAICTPRPPATPSPAADALWAAALRPETWATQVSELDSLWGSASDEVAAGRQSYGAMPLVVLTADGTYAKLPPSVRPSVDELWRRLHAEIAARSSRGRTQVVVNSSHMIMIDRPDAVAEAIAEVLEEARGGRSHERP